MATVGSTVPSLTVKRRLYTFLQELEGVGLAKVPVAWSERAERPKESVFLGETTVSEIEIRSLRASRPRRNEDFTIRINIEAHHRSDEYKAELRAAELLGLIEAALIADPTMGATPGLTTALVESHESDVLEIGTGFTCRYEVTVRCQGVFV